MQGWSFLRDPAKEDDLDKVRGMRIVTKMNLHS
jgi:hypothetical protein